METEASSYGYGLKLAGDIPDQSSGVKRNIGIIAYLVKYGDGRCSLDCFACALFHEYRFDVLCGAPDVSWYGIIAHNTFYYLNALLKDIFSCRRITTHVSGKKVNDDIRLNQLRSDDMVVVFKRMWHVGDGHG